MRTHQTTLIATIITVPLTVAALAWAGELDRLKGSTPEQRATALTALMTSKLDLKPEQKSQVASLNLRYAKKMQPVIEGSAGPFVKMREMKGINEEKEAELKQLLSPEQFDTYLASKDDMRQKAEERIDEKAGGGD